MNATSISVPEARDLDAASIDPWCELASANHLLGDHEALMRSYDEDGYVLLRGVLDIESVRQARAAMFAVMARHGLIAPDAIEPVWTGLPSAGGMEGSEEFTGVARRLIEEPHNLAVMERILGEPACLVSIVQHRTYPPGGSIMGAHQDGFFSPGIVKYKPVWMPLCNCEREVVGLMLAVGQYKRGYLHNLAKPPLSPMPEGLIPQDSWATTEYFPGDVLVIHPSTPHASMPNVSNRCRVTVDTRLQSTADPRVLLGTVASVMPGAIRVRIDGCYERTFRMDKQTSIRVVHPGKRLPLSEFPQATQPGMRLVVVFDGDHAETLRRASEE